MLAGNTRDFRYAAGEESDGMYHYGAFCWVYVSLRRSFTE